MGRSTGIRWIGHTTESCTGPKCEKATFFGRASPVRKRTAQRPPRANSQPAIWPKLAPRLRWHRKHSPETCDRDRHRITNSRARFAPDRAGPVCRFCPSIQNCTGGSRLPAHAADVLIGCLQPPLGVRESLIPCDAGPQIIHKSPGRLRRLKRSVGVAVYGSTVLV